MEQLHFSSNKSLLFPPNTYKVDLKTSGITELKTITDKNQLVTKPWPIKKALIAESFFVDLLGLEPRMSVPKTDVLPITP